MSVVATNGDIVAVGYSASTDGDFHTHVGLYEAVIARFDQDGNRVWSKNCCGNEFDYFESVAIAPNGDIIAVGGSSASDGDFAGEPLAEQAIVIRFASDGSHIWSKAYGGTGDDYFYSVAIAPNGDIIAAGYTSSTDGVFSARNSLQDAAIVRLDQNGDLIWAKACGGSGTDNFLGITLAPNGDIIAVGDTDSTDGDFPVWYSQTDALIARFASDGNLIWGKTYGGRGGESFRSVALAPNGDAIAVGNTGSPDGDFPAQDPAGDAVIARFGDSGDLIWAKTFGGRSGDMFIDVAVATNGDIIAAGYTYSSDGDFPSRHTKADADTVVARLDGTGNLLWAKTHGGSGNDLFGGVAIAANGDLIAVGMATSTDGDFPARDTLGDAVIVRLDENGD
jgi:WD40 repeat protein